MRANLRGSQHNRQFYPLYVGSRTDTPRGTCSRSVFPPPAESARPTGRDTAVHSRNFGHPLDNKLLSSLPREQFDLLAPHLTTVSLEQGTVLIEAGDEFEHVYFPLYGMLSLLAVLKDGKAIETATVGREGVVGAMAGLGLYKSLVRVWCSFQSPSRKFQRRNFGRRPLQATPFVTYASTTMKSCFRRRALLVLATPCMSSKPASAVGCCKRRIGRRAIPLV